MFAAMCAVVSATSLGVHCFAKSCRARTTTTTNMSRLRRERPLAGNEFRTLLANIDLSDLHDDVEKQEHESAIHEDVSPTSPDAQHNIETQVMPKIAQNSPRRKKRTRMSASSSHAPAKLPGLELTSLMSLLSLEEDARQAAAMPRSPRGSDTTGTYAQPKEPDPNPPSPSMSELTSPSTEVTPLLPLDQLERSSTGSDPMRSSEAEVLITPRRPPRYPRHRPI